jgi:hypothetical protein
MSGELISVLGGKVPQRAIRHLSKLPYTSTIQFEAVDWGTPTANLTFNAPSGMRGKVLSIDVTGVTETFTSVTTDPGIQVGIDGGDADAYCTADFADADLAAATAINFNAADGSLVDGVDEIIPAGGIVTITPVAPTGGTPAGIADLGITVLWFE